MNHPMAQTLLARILRHENDYLSTIAQVEQYNGWKAYTNPAFATRIDPNHAGDFRAPVGEAERMVAEVITTFQQRNLTPAAYIDLLSPPDLPAALLRAGFEEWSGATNHLLLYSGGDQPSAAQVNQSVSVNVVTTEEARQSWASIMEESTEADKRLLLQRLYYTEVSEPRITGYLVLVDGEAACRAELFSGDGLGRVEAVRTLERFRGRGFASSAIRRAVSDSQRMGNQITYLYCEPDSAAQRLYLKLGFELAAERITRSFCL